MSHSPISQVEDLVIPLSRYRQILHQDSSLKVHLHYWTEIESPKTRIKLGDQMVNELPRLCILISAPNQYLVMSHLKKYFQV